MGKVYVKGIQITGIDIKFEEKYQLLIRLLPSPKDIELGISKAVVKNGILYYKV